MGYYFSTLNPGFDGMRAILDRPPRHLIPAAEYLRRAEAGAFDPEARLELIEGGILEIAPIGSPHAGTITALTRRPVNEPRFNGARGAQS